MITNAITAGDTLSVKVEASNVGVRRVLIKLVNGI